MIIMTIISRDQIKINVSINKIRTCLNTRFEHNVNVIEKK